MEHQNALNQLDWKKIKENLDTIGVPYEEQEAPKFSKDYIDYCGYVPHPMLVDMSTIETVEARLGVIATHKDQTVNNGVYVFTMGGQDKMGLMTVIPSTISKAPIIRGVIGDITNAITGVLLPPLTPFDMIDVTGQVIVNVIMKNLISALNIPKEQEELFIKAYLPRFLSTIANYQLGIVNENKQPVVQEEFVDMEPVILWEKLKNGNMPAFLNQEQDDSESSETPEDKTFTKESDIAD